VLFEKAAKINVWTWIYGILGMLGIMAEMIAKFYYNSFLVNNKKPAIRILQV
jgi:hypothetical protein